MENKFLFILLIHFLADFSLQTNDQAREKSEGWELYNEHLANHVLVYTLTWWIAILSITDNFLISTGFALMTGVIHYLVDWSSSRISKPLFKINNHHDGFVTVGYDQLIHFICLYYTFQLFNLL